MEKTPKLYVFQRLRGGKLPKPSVFNIIKIKGKVSNSSSAQDGNSVFSRLGKLNEVQSSIPSRKQHISTLDVKTDGSLKVKRRTLVITSYRTSSNSKGKIKDEVQPSSHPITVREANALMAETRLIKPLEIPKNVGDFQHALVSGKFSKHHFP